MTKCSRDVPALQKSAIYLPSLASLQIEIDFVELFDKFDPSFQPLLLEFLLFFCLLVA